MDNGRKETLSVRIISIFFTVLALAIFKPFGLDVWQWQAYVHLLVIFVMGIVSCILTEGILKYIVKMPRSTDLGVSYIIRRNLWFQFINTPLVSLLICLYRHFVMSDYHGSQIPSNVLSWSNYLETLLIIAFLSFAIGLYWRFKYRNRYLVAELEETRRLNEKLRNLTPTPSSAETASFVSSEKNAEQETAMPLTGNQTVVLTGTTSDTITLQISNLLYIEAVGNYVKVYHLRDNEVRTDMLRTTSKQMEDDLQAYPTIVRCHRAFLVNLGQVEQIVSHAGTMQLIIKHSKEAIPVSRSNMSQVKEAINSIQ